MPGSTPLPPTEARRVGWEAVKRAHLAAMGFRAQVRMGHVTRASRRQGLGRASAHLLLRSRELKGKNALSERPRKKGKGFIF